MAAVRFPSDLSNEWLSEKLHATVTAYDVKQIGTGQVSNCFRVTPTYDDPKSGAPASVIMKVASQDAASRAAALRMNLYERETRFYKEIAPELYNGSLAPVYHGEYYKEDNTYCLLLGDAGSNDVGNDLEPTTIERARLAMRELGRLHSKALKNPKLESMDWLVNRGKTLDSGLFQFLFKQWIERYEQRVKPEHMIICSRLVGCFDEYEKESTAKSPIMGLVHGDYRLDNLIFGEGESDRPLTIVDWQTLYWGPFMSDAAYFLGCALEPEVRRAHAEELLQIYHEALGPNAPVTLEQCRAGLVRQTFFGVVMAIVSPIFVERTERGDDLFMALIARHCEHVLDTNALDTLPAPAVLKPLAPVPEDENPHPTGPEKLWQESWYFDFADDAQGFGGWIRVGVDPARNRTWYTTLFCGPDRPTVSVVDFQAPLPDANQTVTAKAFVAGHKVNDPLKSYTCTVEGTGRSFADPAVLLKEGWEQHGEDVPVKMDLTWVSDGTPYKYRIATRYEIPCLISGTVTIGTETIKLQNVLGQRDHSWGARDWWSADWVWSALHFTDGTHIHGLDLRIPSAPRMSLGYIQNARTGLEIAELSSNLCEEAYHPTGLLSKSVWTVASDAVPSEIVADMEIKGHAPLRLVADDGRVAMFPRSWGKITTPDGRTGVAWAEWNKN